MRLVLLAMGLFCLRAPLVGQSPVITPEGMVSAASFSGDPERGAVVVRGRLYSLFGKDLSNGVFAAEQTPLPTVLGGVRLTVGGIAAPLLYVSPGQINFQVPMGIADGSVAVLVTNNGRTSNAIDARTATDAPGLFTANGSGCGQAAALNVGADGSVRVNGPAQSASPGSVVTLFGTGFGATYFPPTDGAASPGEPLSLHMRGPVLGVGQSELGTGAMFAGLAPGLVGVDQLNFVLPTDAPEGCAVPVWAVGTTVASAPATLSIRAGGGQCVDAPLARAGQILWKKTVVSGGTGPGEERFSASFFEGSSAWVRPAAEQRVGVWTTAGSRYAGPKCGGFGGANVNGGTVTVTSSASGPSPVAPVRDSVGEFRYERALAAGALAAGTLTVESAGNSSVGAFRSTIAAPASIEVVNDLRPGTVIDSTKPFTLTWRNGRAGELVHVQIVSEIPQSATDRILSGMQVYVPAENGSVTLGTLELFPERPSLPVTPGLGTRIIVRQMPRTAATFVAPGMTFPATHAWQYEFQFLGLKLVSQP